MINANPYGSNRGYGGGYGGLAYVQEPSYGHGSYGGHGGHSYRQPLYSNPQMPVLLPPLLLAMVASAQATTGSWLFPAMRSTPVTTVLAVVTALAMDAASTKCSNY